MKRSDPQDMEVMAEPVAKLAMSKAERIERWADLLDKQEGRVLPLPGIEYMTPEARRNLSGQHYPMTVAFADPVFRSLGLKGETLGESLEFFGMTDEDAHNIMCESVSTGASIAGRLRHFAKTGNSSNLWTHARRLFGGF